MAEPAKKKRKTDKLNDSANDKINLPTCPYGASCYRKNPAHFKEYSHPKNTPTTASAATTSDGGSSTDHKASKDMPACPYGTNCYRKNLLHFAEFWHPTVNDENDDSRDNSQNCEDDDDDTDTYNEDTDDESEQKEYCKSKVQKTWSRGPSIVARYSDLTEEERKELIQKAMEAKKQMEEELKETKKKMIEEDKELQKIQAMLGKGGIPLVDGEKEALEGNEVVHFPFQAEREYKQGSANQAHFRLAESQFYRLLPPGVQIRIKKVDYAVSPEVVKRFRKAQEMLRKKRGEDSSYPVLAFHGTADANIDSIVKDGFKVPGQDGFKHSTDIGIYGRGLYFSEYPRYSMTYIRGGTRLLLCLVLVGKAYHCDNLMRGAAKMKGYDSHTSPNSKELIIFDSSQILPCYIVHYAFQYSEFRYKTSVKEKTEEELKKLYDRALRVKPCNIFKGLAVFLAEAKGALKDDIMKLITKFGAKESEGFQSFHTEVRNRIVVGSWETYDTETMLISYAERYQVPVLMEHYLYDSILAGGKMSMKEYGMFIPMWYGVTT
ncbi:uncharacterized protein LOC144434691 [Glandiceps talaboti]